MGLVVWLERQVHLYRDVWHTLRSRAREKKPSKQIRGVTGRLETITPRRILCLLAPKEKKGFGFVPQKKKKKTRYTAELFHRHTSDERGANGKA